MASDSKGRSKLKKRLRDARDLLSMTSLTKVGRMAICRPGRPGVRTPRLTITTIKPTIRYHTHTRRSGTRAWTCRTSNTSRSSSVRSKRIDHISGPHPAPNLPPDTKSRLTFRYSPLHTTKRRFEFSIEEDVAEAHRGRPDAHLPAREARALRRAPRLAAHRLQPHPHAGAPGRAGDVGRGLRGVHGEQQQPVRRVGAGGALCVGVRALLALSGVVV